MKRITVEQVLAAYEKTGLEKMRDGYGDGVTCGCPLTALCVANLGKPPDSCSVLAWAANEYGELYRRGFVDAVDGVAYIHGPDEEYRTGYTDGEAVRKALWGA